MNRALVKTCLGGFDHDNSDSGLGFRRGEAISKQAAEVLTFVRSGLARFNEARIPFCVVLALATDMSEVANYLETNNFEDFEDFKSNLVGLVLTLQPVGPLKRLIMQYLVFICDDMKLDESSMDKNTSELHKTGNLASITDITCDDNGYAVFTICEALVGQTDALTFTLKPNEDMTLILKSILKLFVATMQSSKQNTPAIDFKQSPINFNNFQ